MKIEYQWVESFQVQIRTRIHNLRRLRKLQIRSLRYRMWRMTEMGSSSLGLTRMAEKKTRSLRQGWLRKMKSQQKCMMNKISTQLINISILPSLTAPNLFPIKNAFSFQTKRGPSRTLTFTISFPSNSILLWRATARSNTSATAWSTNSLIQSREVRRIKSSLTWPTNSTATIMQVLISLILRSNSSTNSSKM